MPIHTKKHARLLRNVTKKCKLSKPELQLICKNENDTRRVFDSFESVFEKTFKHSLKTENANVERALIKLFKTPFAPSKITPRNDYYTYINYQWIAKKTKELETTKKFYVQMDNFRITQEKVYYELMEIVKE